MGSGTEVSLRQANGPVLTVKFTSPEASAPVAAQAKEVVIV
jgi:hypothetical protein